MAAKSQLINAVILLCIFFFADLITNFTQAFPQNDPNCKLKENFSVIDDYRLLIGSRNIAANNFLNTSFISVSIQNQLLIKELMNKNSSAQWKYKANAFFVEINHFGYSRYGEMKLSAGYSKRFGSKIAIGLNFHYLLHHAIHYGTENSFTFDLSFQTAISEKLGFGFVVYNPARLKYGITGEEIIPVVFIYDCYYKIGNKLLFFSEIEKKIPGVFNVGLGMTCHFSQMSITSSLSLTSLSFLISTEWHSFIFGIRTDCHYKTGISPTLNLYYLL
jgi:hypothetical protein